jgi:hypothetical protein
MRGIALEMWLPVLDAIRTAVHDLGSTRLASLVELQGLALAG